MLEWRASGAFRSFPVGRRTPLNADPLGSRAVPDTLAISRASAFRFLGAVVAGAATWPLVLGTGFVVLRASWPEYVAAQPEKSYTLAMLFCRLVIYSSAIVATSAVAGGVARSERMAWFSGAVILAFAIPPHLYPGSVWSDYPVWYHLLFLASILPLSWLGGRTLSLFAFTRSHTAAAKQGDAAGRQGA